MEPLQTPQSNQNQAMPHIEVQVYQQSGSDTTKQQNPHIIHISDPMQNAQGTITYQLPPNQRLEQLHEMQTLHVQSCTQQMGMQSQLLQSQMAQPHMEVQSQPVQSLQIAQQIIVPVFKQHMVMNTLPPHTQHYYGQFEYQKQQADCVIPKLEPDIQLTTLNKLHCKSEQLTAVKDNEISEADPLANTSTTEGRNRTRNTIPDPSKWACNVRKLKHQRGEAYVNRRGKFVPERKVKNTKDCLKSCKFKCNKHISDVDRAHIFKAFYSLSANEKKHFLLNTTERTYTKRIMTTDLEEEPKRKFSFKYFFLVRAVRYTVCKNYYLGTLAISQKPVYNVHLGKSEINIPKPDGRGLTETSTQGISLELKEKVRKHIKSFNTVDSKPIIPFSRKKQFLFPNLSVKQMYKMYLSECINENIESVKESMYRKIFKREFNLEFKKIKLEQPVCSKCKGPVKKK